jgi:hypothetical protein
MNEDVEYRVFCLLAAPSSGSAKLPIDGSQVLYPDEWRSPFVTGPLTPITAADIE